MPLELPRAPAGLRSRDRLEPELAVTILQSSLATSGSNITRWSAADTLPRRTPLGLRHTRVNACPAPRPQFDFVSAV